MNKLYPLATLLATTLLIHGAQAQTYTGGTYTAERNKPWHVTSGVNAWDINGEPPANCINCKIVIKSGVTVDMNAHVTLSGGSLLQVGTDGTAATALVINSSGSSDWSSSYNVILVNDGNSNQLKMNDGLSSVNAANAGAYDGVLVSFTQTSGTTYYKTVGTAPSVFNENTAIFQTPAAYGKTLTGSATLSSTGTLPIFFSGFDAVLNNGEVNVTWTTQFEQNSGHFDIERSADGGAKWDVIGKAAARGYSSSPVNYSFTDDNPGSGTIQYRVHGYDLDGRPTLSTIKVIRTTQLANVSIFPNPAKDYVNVSLPTSEATAGTVSVRLIGQTGQLLVERRVTGAGGTTLSIPVSSYAPGNYLVQIVTADGSKQVSKVVISRQ